MRAEHGSDFTPLNRIENAGMLVLLGSHLTFQLIGPSSLFG